VCRELPGIAPGASAGAAFAWQRACFADVLGGVGAPCRGADDKLAPSACVTGQCLDAGARGLCTMDCGELSCPSGTMCATFNREPGRPVCIPRCDAQRPCDDPLLGCERAAPVGAWAFVAAGEPADATACAPRRCSRTVDCAPSGVCELPDGGVVVDAGAADLAAVVDLATMDGVLWVDAGATDLAEAVDLEMAVDAAAAGDLATAAGDLGADEPGEASDLGAVALDGEVRDLGAAPDLGQPPDLAPPGGEGFCRRN
jgi:hypothetical protein